MSQNSPQETTRLRLDGMHRRHRALTAAIASAYQEAASVCLSRHHSSPIEISISDNGASSQTEINWAAPDSRVLAAWSNTVDTTEAGAYACVIAGVEQLRGLFAVRRAETGTGADYYVGPHGSGDEDLESCWRLEVSGVDGGTADAVTSRLRAKSRQASQGESNLPALAGVIGFAARLLIICDVVEEL
jgi:hypothetical protein